MKKIVFLGLLSAFLFSCKNEHKIEQVERAFYYWKSDPWSFSEGEDSIRKKVEATKIYIKFFEVDYHEEMGNYPVSKTRMSIYGDAQFNYVPTVYIKNSVFLHSDKENLDILADNVNFLIRKYCKERFENLPEPTEFQMDCDWTLKSKDNYFYFLKKLKSISKKQISCTLRLYPYKYRTKMGIPPVDKATLMCYNLMNPLENQNKNSILDLDELEDYLNVDAKYPIHLDVALPLYSWMQVYQNERFSEVIYSDNKKIKSVLKEVKPLWFDVTKDTVIGELYLRVGDKVKFEEINVKKIKGAIKILKENIDFDSNTTVSFFHLDDQQLSNFKDEEIIGFYTDFSK